MFHARAKKKKQGAAADNGNRAPFCVRLFVGKRKDAFGKCAVRHSLQFFDRYGGKLAHILVHIRYGFKDIINYPLAAVCRIDTD